MGKELNLKVKGMTCEHCVHTVRTAVLQVEGVEDVNIDLASGSVNVTASENVPVDKIKEAIHQRGYTVID